MAHKPKKIQPGQGGQNKDSFYSRGSSNITVTNGSVISQMLEPNQVSKKQNESGEMPGNTEPEDSFLFDQSPKNTASEMD